MEACHSVTVRLVATLMFVCSDNDDCHAFTNRIHSGKMDNEGKAASLSKSDEATASTLDGDLAPLLTTNMKAYLHREAKRLSELAAASSCPACSERDSSGTSSVSTKSTSSHWSVDAEDRTGASDASNDDYALEERGRAQAEVSTHRQMSDVSEYDFNEDVRSTALPSRAPSIWDEVEHPVLSNALEALRIYEASSGDVAWLEEAYEQARRVISNNQRVDVAFAAWRIAFAAGYVYNLRRGGKDTARYFVVRHSYPRLVQSLEAYWGSPDAWRTFAEELEWDNCMHELLEVTSSVLLTLDEDVLSDDIDGTVEDRVRQALGRYCIANPTTLSEYPQIAKPCVLRHLSTLRNHDLHRARSSLTWRTLSKNDSAHTCFIHSSE